MKKTIKIGLACGLFFAALTSSNAQVFYEDNDASGLGSSALGKYCNSTSNYSFVSGYKSNATGLYSIALGVRNLSSSSHATTIGIDIEATANRSMVIGSGSSSGTFGTYPIPKLINNIPGSLMVGFNSDIPTFFVGEAQGVGTFGNVGIGTSVPTTTLDVNGTIKSSKGWGDWLQMHTTNGNGFWRVHNPQSQKYLVFGWDDGSATDQSYSLYTHQNGDVSIGTNDSEGYKLAVNGHMIAEEITVKLHSNWPDFVFTDNYGLMELDDVKSYINENSHLPNVPSAKEIEEGGINLGEMDAILLQKIEELTLYMIDIKDENEKLKSRIEEMETIKLK